MRVDPRVERTPAGLHMPPQRVRDERFRIASEMLALNLRAAALWPVRQQEQQRTAMHCLSDVQQWCRAHQEPQ